MTTSCLLKVSSLEELKKEPWRLQIQVENTEEQLRNLVLKNYHVFIQSNQCSKMVNDQLIDLKKQTVEITQQFPALREHCAEFQEDVKKIAAKHGEIQFILEHYLQLTELLEIPQLLEACIHNELFEEAMDMIQFAKEIFRPEKKNSNTNFIITTLLREIGQMTELLREKLLQKLREDLQLAFCVRVVSYLRRVDALKNQTSITTYEYECKLKEEFLTSRTIWLNSLTRGIATMDPYQYMIQLIDAKRISWFDMITQYTAIFGSENIEGKVDPSLCRWATSNVADFLQILSKQLPKIEDFSSIATIVEQSLFFGGSLGRVGVDFRAVLAVYFEDHVYNLMVDSWQFACREFEENLNAHGRENSASIRLAATPLMIVSSSSSSFTLTQSSSCNSSEENYAPPRRLMSFPILAELMNSFLTSLNDLRLCVLSSLNFRLSKCLQSSIAAVIISIGEFCQQNNVHLVEEEEEEEEKEGKKIKTVAIVNPAAGIGSIPPTRNNSSSASGKSTLHEQMKGIVEALQLDFIPFLIKCFQRLFPHGAKNFVYLRQEYFIEIMIESMLLPPSLRVAPQPSSKVQTENSIITTSISSNVTTSAMVDEPVVEEEEEEIKEEEIEEEEIDENKTQAEEEEKEKVKEKVKEVLDQTEDTIKKEESVQKEEEES